MVSGCKEATGFMSTANVLIANTSHEQRSPLGDRHGWGFVLLLLAVATLFLRPSDLIPALATWPIYQLLIGCCLIVSARTTIIGFAQQQLVAQPATFSLLVLLLAVGLSHLSHGSVWGMRASTYEVGKLLALYLLIVGLVNTPQRLVLLLRWLTVAISTVAALALLDHFEVVSIAALASIQQYGGVGAGEQLMLERIRGTGIFQDPNDFGLILVTGLVFCCSFLVQPNLGWLRYQWLLPGGVLLTALALTHSRGALLSLICGVAALLAYYRGGKWGAWSLLGLPLVALTFSARMTNIDALHEGTGQARIQLWSDSLSVWRTYPMFGLGEGLLVDEIGMVTHNSFVHCYAELGLFGGTAFLASFLAAGLGLWSYRQAELTVDRPATNSPAAMLAHHGGFMFAALVAYAAGMMTISRQFVAPTYLILGIATSAHSLCTGEVVRWRVGNAFLAMSVCCSLTSLLGFYIAIRILVRW